MQYMVVNAARIEDLEKAVNNLIEDGYRPYGSLVTVTEQYRTMFYQPMIFMKIFVK